MKLKIGEDVKISMVARRNLFMNLILALKHKHNVYEKCYNVSTAT